MDYKTNSSLEINEEQRLQLAIYALLYRKTHGDIPDKAGIFFLRSKPKFITIDPNLLKEAEVEIFDVHEKTRSPEKSDYPIKEGPLCKWCNFYSICFEQKPITEYLAEVRATKP